MEINVVSLLGSLIINSMMLLFLSQWVGREEDANGHKMATNNHILIYPFIINEVQKQYAREIMKGNDMKIRFAEHSK